MIATDKFKRDLRGSMPGEWAQYHRGVLMIARQSNTALDQIATLLWNLALLGDVFLIQKRDDEGVMTYKYQVRRRISRERIEEAERL